MPRNLLLKSDNALQLIVQAFGGLYIGPHLPLRFQSCLQKQLEHVLKNRMRYLNLQHIEIDGLRQ